MKNEKSIFQFLIYFVHRASISTPKSSLPLNTAPPRLLPPNTHSPGFCSCCELPLPSKHTLLLATHTTPLHTHPIFLILTNHSPDRTWDLLKHPAGASPYRSITQLHITRLYTYIPQNVSAQLSYALCDLPNQSIVL